jgi:hypothetical protein
MHITWTRPDPVDQVPCHPERSPSGDWSTSSRQLPRNCDYFLAQHEPVSYSAINQVGSSRSLFSSGSLAASFALPRKPMTGSPVQLQGTARVGTFVKRTRFLRLLNSEILCHHRNRGVCIWAESLIDASVRSMSRQKRVGVRFADGRTVMLHFGSVDGAKVWAQALAEASKEGHGKPH